MMLKFTDENGTKFHINSAAISHVCRWIVWRHGGESGMGAAIFTWFPQPVIVLETEAEVLAMLERVRLDEAYKTSR